MRFLIHLIQEIVILVVQRIELILGADAAVQRLTILPELNVGQSSGDALRPVGVEGIDVDGSPDVTARVDRQRIGDLHAPAVDHAGLFLTGGVDEIAISIGWILRAIHVAVAQGQLQVRRNLTAPLGHALLFCLLNGFPDFPDRHGIALGNDEGAAVLGFAAVDALRLENVNEGRANLASDDFDGHSVFLSARMGHSIKSTNGTEMLLIVAIGRLFLEIARRIGIRLAGIGFGNERRRALRLDDVPAQHLAELLSAQSLFQIAHAQ